MAKRKTGSEKKGATKTAAEKRVEAANRRVARSRARGGATGPVPF